MPTAILRAGIPATNKLLFHRMRFSVGDPAAIVDLPARDGVAARSVLILRAIEMERARKHARVDAVHCPEDFAPREGLSGDREVGTAQAVAELLRREGVTRVRADRTLPLLYAHHLAKAGIACDCAVDLGIAERRAKDAQEIAHLRAAQALTEELMALACGTVRRATAGADGVLQHEGAPLTSERLRRMIDLWALERGAVTPDSIVASGPIGADCHHFGAGPLRTGEPVIVDIFPLVRSTGYNGDCTRTVVHGTVPERVRRMHAVVVEAKTAATAATRAGATGEAVHEATRGVMTRHGMGMGMPPDGADDDWCGMTHGTGHGIGLDVHEPPLLDRAGPPLVVGDALTIEPGLYCRAVGGVRVEDMVIVTADGCENLNRLPEGLEDW